MVKVMVTRVRKVAVLAAVGCFLLVVFLVYTPSGRSEGGDGGGAGGEGEVAGQVWQALKQGRRYLEHPPSKQVQSPPAASGRGHYHGRPCGHAGEWVEGLPPLYIITPTYPRAEQIPELTRLGQTLMNVPNVVWIVSEDTAVATPEVLQYLNDTGLPTVYRKVQMPAKYQSVKNKPRGVANRLAGLQYVREHAKDGVFYFADDDNSYDIRIFEQMRWTRKVSMFPVGLVTKLGVSTPIVRDGVVMGFYDGWIAKRKFPIDMAGFAVSVQYLLERPEATMPFVVGYEEDGFMKSLGIKVHEIEPLAFNCTKIWVWHTQTKKNDAAQPVPSNTSTLGTNLDVIRTLLWKGKGNTPANTPAKTPAKAPVKAPAQSPVRRKYGRSP